VVPPHDWEDPIVIAISFLRPEFLWLLLLIPAVWFWPRRTRDGWHAALRSLVLILAILAICAPIQVTNDTRQHHVIVVDLSASTAPDAGEKARAIVQDLLSKLQSNTTLSFVGLGTKVPGFDAIAPDFQSVRSLNGNTSDLSAALAVAGLQIPEGANGAVTLVSDGLATNQRWARAMQTLTARSIPLHGIELATVETDIRPIGLSTADDLRVGQSARILVDVFGPPSEIRLHLSGSSGKLVSSEPIQLDGWRRIGLTFEPKKAGFFDFTATVEVVSGPDQRPDNNTISTLLAIQDPLRVLYFGGRVEGSDRKLSELLGSGFAIEPAGDLSQEGPSLDSYDLVMLDDAPAQSVPRELQKQIVSQVNDHGLGVCMSGGGSSFGPGGYHKTPIESILPVDLVQKEEKKDPSTSLAVIIDTSGSMGGNRIVLAKEVTRLALRRLLPHDKIGIVEFYGNKRWAAPLQSAANAIDIQRALNRLDAGGGTILFPAIEEAYYGLRNAQTRYKHVLVLTDAGVESGPYEQLLRRMARDGVCVSTVLVGPGRHSEFLVELADWGRGRFYNASDRFNLPEIMLKQPSSSRLPGYRPGQQMVETRGGQGWWGESGPKSVPPINGYVETRPRQGADVLVRTQRDSHPILASWRFGLGRVTAMTTEPTGPGTSEWQKWADYGSTLGRILARTAADSRNAFLFNLERRDHQLILTAQRLVGANLRPKARMQAESPREFQFQERAVGRFEARLDVAIDQPARVIAGVEGRDRGNTRLASPAFGDSSAELQVDPQAQFDLRAAAKASGGKLLSLGQFSSSDLSVGGGTQPLAINRLWPLCLLLALLIYLAELIWRRSPRHRAAE
jgi:Ca-activated chloride channel family protein